MDMPAAPTTPDRDSARPLPAQPGRSQLIGWTKRLRADLLRMQRELEDTTDPRTMAFRVRGSHYSASFYWRSITAAVDA